MSTPETEYTAAASLTYLEGLEAVRKRPGMYIGSTDSRGLQHCLWEIIDNSVDEGIAGHCTRIVVTLHEDGSLEVEDNGRGIPVDIEPKSGLTGVELVFTKLHAGGKFGGGGYAVSGGLHGVGASVVNALSTRLDVRVNRGGTTHTLSFQHGTAGEFNAKGTFTPGSKLRSAGKVAKTVTGTTVRYWPDMDIFLPGATVDLDKTYARARQTAFLVPGLTLVVRDYRTADAHTEETFHFDGGVRDFVEYRANDRAMSDTLVFCGQGTFTERVPVLAAGKSELADVQRTVDVEIGARWGIGYDPNVISFVNIISTPKGGTHVAGFERALVKVVNEQLKSQRVLKASDEAVIKEDILEGLTAVVTVRLAEPQFEGQTKEILGTRDVAGIVTKVVSAALEDYFAGKTSKATKAEGRKVLEKVAAAAKTRLAARELKETKRRKTALESSSMPAKLVDCRSEDITDAELFIVEGDSALGTFKQGRDSEFQAALPIRGKILNTLRATEKQMLANAECAAIIQVMGGGSGRSFDLDTIRYGKLIFLTDADVDGSHIRCLLLTLVYKYMRPLIDNGNIYAAVPPLHQVKLGPARNPEVYYTYSDDELRELLRELEAAGKKVPEDGVQRYKGLGEMDAIQLAETTLDPARRRLRRMTIEDAEEALATFELCMGAEVGPRKDFIVSEGGLLDPEMVDA